MKLRRAVTAFHSNILASLLITWVVICPVSPASAQAIDQLLNSFVGQKLILCRFGDKDEANIKRESLSRQGRGCDAAVEIREAGLKGDKLRLRLEHIGVPVIPPKKRQSCSAYPIETILTVSGIGKQEPTSAIVQTLSQIIQTPDEYLTTNGVLLRSQRKQLGAPVVELANSSETPPGITRARLALIVNAAYPDDARRRRIQGVVRVAIEVGTDGLVQSARILKGVDPSLDRQVLRVLPLFRFEPGQKDGQVAVVRTQMEMSFRLF